MDDRVRTEYEKILTAAILKHGSLVRKDASQYGWLDGLEYGEGWKNPRHSVQCGIAKTGRIVEDAYWYEFMGTCNCGKITDRVFRWSESPGEAIRIVLESVLEDKVKSSE
jgi:hypothetical protein